MCKIKRIYCVNNLFLHINVLYPADICVKINHLHMKCVLFYTLMLTHVEFSLNSPTRYYGDLLRDIL